jgi:hypothetical protein
MRNQKRQRAARSGEAACSALQVEVWECRACDDRAPCRVEITFSDAKLPQHLKGNQRFRRMDCLCNERPDPLWVRMPNKEIKTKMPNPTQGATHAPPR